MKKKLFFFSISIDENFESNTIFSENDIWQLSEIIKDLLTVKVDLICQNCGIDYQKPKEVQDDFLKTQDKLLHKKLTYCDKCRVQKDFEVFKNHANSIFNALS